MSRADGLYSWRRVRKIGRIRAPADWTEGKEESVCRGGVGGNGQFHETGTLIWKTDLQTRERLSFLIRRDFPQPDLRPTPDDPVWCHNSKWR